MVAEAAAPRRKNVPRHILLYIHRKNGGFEMSKYDKVPTDLKFVEREKEVEKFWKDNDIFL